MQDCIIPVLKWQAQYPSNMSILFCPAWSHWSPGLQCISPALHGEFRFSTNLSYFFLFCTDISISFLFLSLILLQSIHSYLHTFQCVAPLSSRSETQELALTFLPLWLSPVESPAVCLMSSFCFKSIDQGEGGQRPCQVSPGWFLYITLARSILQGTVVVTL